MITRDDPMVNDFMPLVRILDSSNRHNVDFIINDILIYLQAATNHDDFKNEKLRTVNYLEEKGHTALFLPKFHPELNPIERVWGQAKRYSKAHCNYMLPSLRKVNLPALDSISLELINQYNKKG